MRLLESYLLELRKIRLMTREKYSRTVLLSSDPVGKIL